MSTGATGLSGSTNGLAVTNHVLFLATNLQPGWTHELHSGNGNIVLADGSVLRATTILRQGLNAAQADIGDSVTLSWHPDASVVLTR